jgi:hypothetical protein
VVLCNFAKNYAFIFQDEAQGVYWNNAHATTHPFAIYIKKSDALHTGHEIPVTDCMRHDSISIHTF